MQGMAMQSVIAAMADRSGPASVDYDFVLVAGHFLARDENIFTYFEVLPCQIMRIIALKWEIWNEIVNFGEGRYI